MIKIEQNYEFRQRMDQVHKPKCRSEYAVKETGEVEITEQWEISYQYDAPEVVKMAAKDLQDYFLVSMEINLPIVPGGNRGILLQFDSNLMKSGSYATEVQQDKIVISGFDGKGIRFGCVHLEDMLNLREAPFIRLGSEKHDLLISPRIVHSGWGMDKFPDKHLNAILHAGFDAITIFTVDIDLTEIGPLDINDVISRASNYGIDTYLYSYLPAYKHPDDSDAPEFFANVYTRLLNYHRGAKGVMLVGESAVFPSKDPATTGKKWKESMVDGIPDSRPSPGWWPCEDYPRWIQRVCDAVHAANPEAKVIFNTYNWGWAPLEMRRKFLKNLPAGVIIQVTFDIFSRSTRGGLPSVAMDYTITADKPGYYFSSECQAAAEFGIPLLSTANTAGMTWDYGDVPYIPVPQQWIRRFKELDRFRKECGLNSFYDCHHYGWWPSVITELGKWYFQSPQQDLDSMLYKLAVRMANKGADLLVEAWNLWSEGIKLLTPTNEDQYGPLRVGPSYPLIFHPNITRTMGNKEIKFPTAPGAHFGYKIIKTLYQPYENEYQLPGSLRYPAELCSLDKMLDLWKQGIDKYTMAIELAPMKKREELERELNMGKFIYHSTITCRNVKKWYMLNRQLMDAVTAEMGLNKLDEIEKLACEEIENARQTIALVEKDSRLGWEPSMEYVCDKWHLEWKIRQVENMISGEIAAYRKSLNVR